MSSDYLPRLGPRFITVTAHMGRFFFSAMQYNHPHLNFEEQADWYAMISANERMRETTHGAPNHSGPDGRSYGDWHAEGDTNPHNPACRGGSWHQRLLLSERCYGTAIIYDLQFV